MEKVYLIAEWYYADHWPSYEVISVHLDKEQAELNFKEHLSNKIEVEEFKEITNAENASKGAKYRKDESHMGGNELFLYEIQLDEKIELKNEDKFNL